jgi:hypothetical protein
MDTDMAATDNTAHSGNANESDAPSQGATVNAETAANEIVVDGVVGADASFAQAQEGEAAVASEQDASAVMSNSIAVLLPGDAQMLQLADLLQGEHDGNLDALLMFSSDGTNTTIHIATGGDRPTQEQEIVLQGVGDLTAGGVRSASVIIGDLLMQGTFVSDS